LLSTLPLEKLLILSVYGEAESGKRSDQLKLARTERSKTADDFFNGHAGLL
jgi:hypothetical protein